MNSARPEPERILNLDEPALVPAVDEAIQLIKAGKAAEALVMLDSMPEQTADVFTAKGWAHQKMGNFDAAVISYDKAASGQQLAKFVASDAAADDYFGYSVAISGDLVVVGAYRDDDAGSKTGSAYVFRTTNDGGSWTQTAKLVASDAAKDNYFGKSVAISGDPRRRRSGREERRLRRRQRRPASSGAYGNDDAGSSSGSAYVFRTRNSGASWTQTAKLLASDAAADDYFGYSAAISGDLTAKLVASDAAKDNYFGKSAAISGDLAVAGADGRNEDVGSAYVFRTRNDGASWSQTAKLLASDAAKDDGVFGESVAVSGDLATAKLLASDAAQDNFATPSPSAATRRRRAFEDDDAGSSSGSAYVLPADGSARRHGAPPERDVPFAPAWMAPGDGLETHSVEELKAMANARGVSLAGRLEKTDIIAAPSARRRRWTLSPCQSTMHPPARGTSRARRPLRRCPPRPSLPHRAAAREPGFRGRAEAPPLAVGARVAYDRDGAARLGVVVAVHNEDPSGPYYTVRLDGPVPRDVQAERRRSPAGRDAAANAAPAARLPGRAR
ncbi:hypothetical protein SO694_0002717 [Aureococcus anophagefferens]|uniref:Rho termination factor N-terminal domain-containing protein n=1 Tax=Aureococcus anophagefferens TaxID=44056 RepID=A0ABR1FUW2_AURAN